MARFILPIPGLDPLYDAQLQAWREEFFGWPSGPNSERTLSPPLESVHANAHTARGKAPEAASTDDFAGSTRKAPTPSDQFFSS